MTFVQKKIENKFDKTGIILSSLCLVHCLGTPLALAMSPSIASYFENEMIHWGLFMLVAPIACYILYTQRKNHQKNLPLILGMIGIISLFMGIISEEVAIFSEAIFTIAGSGFLVAAHTLNIKHDRSCKTCAHH